MGRTIATIQANSSRKGCCSLLVGLPLRRYLERQWRGRFLEGAGRGIADDQAPGHCQVGSTGVTLLKSGRELSVTGSPSLRGP